MRCEPVNVRFLVQIKTDGIYTSATPVKAVKEGRDIVRKRERKRKNAEFMCAYIVWAVFIL